MEWRKLAGGVEEADGATMFRGGRRGRGSTAGPSRLDPVYEEEEGVFYEDRSGDIIADDNLARLMTLPNVLVTSHMGFFTREAMQAIARTTLENAYALENGLPLVNQVGKEMAL